MRTGTSMHILALMNVAKQAAATPPLGEREIDFQVHFSVGTLQPDFWAS